MKEININDLISKVDIVNVISNFSSLTKAGTSFKTLCNVHGDKSPSLSINPKKQIYKCFVCDHGGNALDYLIWAQKFTFSDAIEYLIKESGENIEQYKSLISRKKYSENEMKLFKALKDASDIFNYYLNIALDDNDEVKSFVESRKLTKAIINKFKLGYAPNLNEDNYVKLLEKKDNEKSTLMNASLLGDNGEFPFYIKKIIFPICDDEGNIVAFSGRRIDDNEDTPKYLNSKESLVFKKSSILYNYNNARRFENIIIVEGFMDVIAFSKIGYDNAIALMGTALSKDHINKLKKHKEILIFLDNDSAGQLATMKIIKVLIENEIKGYVIRNDSSKDADEILNNHNGKEQLLKILESKIKMNDFIFEYFTRDVNLDDFEAIKKMIIDIYKYAKKFDDFIKLDLISKISNKFKISKDLINKYFDSKPNVIELRQLEKTNINTKQTLELELNQPLNIKKILISIWKNPAYLKMQNIGYEKWPEYKLRKIFEEIKNFYENHSQLSKETINFIRMNEKFFNSNQSLPQNEEAFIELIERANNEAKEDKLKRIGYYIDSTDDKKQKDELLDKSFRIIKNKRRG